MMLRREVFWIALGLVVLLGTLVGDVAAQGPAAQEPAPGFASYNVTPLPPVAEPPAEVEQPSPSDLPPPASLPEEIPAPPDEIELDGEFEIPPFDLEAPDSPAKVEDDELLLAPPPTFFEMWNLWESSFELGINGSIGNTDTHTWRGALRTKRETPWSKFTVDADYKKAFQNSEVIADRLYFEWRAEFPFQQSAWSAYVHGTVEFDEFRAFDVRVTDDAGLGYQWYKTDKSSLKTRTGAGASREFGGPEDRYVPEAVTGIDIERKISKRQKIGTSVEYFFDWTDFGENRANLKAGWEVILDHEAHLSLKFGVINRYDSTPNGAKPNDLDYSAVMLWNF